MKTTGFNLGGWGGLLAALVPIILAMFKINLPDNIVQVIVEWISGNFAASGLILTGVGAGLYNRKLSRDEVRKKVIASGAGHYCPTTGKFVWKCDEEKQAGE